MNSVNGWGRWLAAVLVLLALGARAEVKPAVEPLISPDEMVSVSQVRPGMKGYGQSVFEGTKIERFNVTVLGVLRKIDFGGDMILIRIEDGPPVTSKAGVSAGMSGSPIYVDGKLVGALAFAWPFARDPVAGVTPIAQMLENYRPGSAPPPPAVAQAGDLQPEGGPLRLDGHLFARASVVADRGLVPAGTGSTLYLTPVATPVMIAGMGRAGLDEMKRRLGRYSALAVPGPGRTDLPPGERPRLEPGAAVGVQLLSGDVDATAIGTVTYVKGEHVLAFGHPMFGLGTIDMPMATAFIHGVISSQEVSFKMGSPVETVGHITQDRNWSIGGATGQPARTVSAEFVVTDSSRGVKRDYKVQAAIQRDLTPTLLYGSMLNAVSSVSPPTAGTTRGTVEIWAKGLPPIRRENVFAMGERRSALEQLFGDPTAGMPLVEMLQILDTLENNSFGAVPVERLRVEVDVSETRRKAAIERAYADRKRVKPGEKVKIGVVIQPANGPKEVREFEMEIPRNIPGGRLQIGVAGGASAERIRQSMQIGRPPAKTLMQLVGQIAGREQNSDLTLELAQPVAGISVAGREFPNLPNVVVEVLTGANPSGIRMLRSHTRQTYPTSWVLSGGQLLSLQVDADEKDKTGPALAPGVGGLGGLTSILDLFRTGLGVDGADFGGDAGTDGLTEGDEDAGQAAIQGLPVGRGTRRAPGAERRDEPAMPSFEELQRILEGETETSGDGDVGTSTPSRKGLARTPGVWRLGSAKDFQSGKLEGVLISSRGELALAPQASPLLTSPDRFFWAQTADSAGNVYVGGWLDGSVLRIDPAGHSTKLWEGEGETAVSALVMDGDGALFAAAEPSGTIYRVDASGKAAPFCRLPDERVWALRKIGGSLYAGTGPEGRLYRIGASGTPAVLFTAPDRHILALAEDGKGAVYCGTYPRGKIFRLRGEKVEPVYELPSSAVTALACDAKGCLYAGTSPRASVVKITPDWDASVLFQSKERHVFSLIVDEKENVYAGVGGQARVYRVAPDRTVSTLWDPQAAYVLSLSRDGAGNLYATTAGPTQIVRLSAAPAPQGTYTSAILNAGNLARWGAARWSGAGAGVQIQTRSGNTGYPDSTWSAWSEPQTRAAGAPIASPPGQYLQYRILLKGAGSPAVRNLELFYRPRNRAPEVTLKAPAAAEILSGGRVVRWVGKDPDQDRLQYDVYYSREGTEKWVKIGTRVGPAGGDEEELDLEKLQAPAPDGSQGALPAAPSLGRLPGRSSDAVVTARNPRSPLPLAASRRRKSAAPKVAALVPAVEASAPPAEEEAALGEEELAGGPSLTWNTRRVPDGRYRVKVVATDLLSSPDEPLAGEAVSELVQVDNTAPKLLLRQAKRAGLAPPAEVPVRDEGTYVASAEYRLDGGEWLAAVAADGIFDSPEEAVRLDAARLKPGKHVLEIRTRDAAGNEAVAKVWYVLPATGAK